jgi:multisubunit Na+/H+ antiporter MnhC subunit
MLRSELSSVSNGLFVRALPANPAAFRAGYASQFTVSGETTRVSITATYRADPLIKIFAMTQLVLSGCFQAANLRACHS